MKLLVITQKLDPDDYVFGFFYGHIIDLSVVCERLIVVCLEKAPGVVLPDNVTIFSLGKEDGAGRIARLRRLFKVVFGNSYDTVFVRMDTIYLLLCGWWWRLSGKRIVLWFNHINQDAKLKIAVRFAHEVLSASKFGLPVGHKNVRLIDYTNDITKLLTDK